LFHTSRATPNDLPPRTLQIERILPLLKQLESRLEVKSFGVRAAVHALSTLVEGTSLANELAEFDQSITALAYDAALSKLHELLKHLQRP
jgi:predicted NAD/FAD-binding protein